MAIFKRAKIKMGGQEIRKAEPKELDMETIERIVGRIEQMALDYDIPYPSGGELRPWQKEIMMNGH